MTDHNRLDRFEDGARATGAIVAAIAAVAYAARTVQSFFDGGEVDE